ncbi:hypothetical protein [Bradyrhizobium erythrophlei]|uniref:Uncharacterized protein n=1 Tax=Bradyrhizobium erythrophlei TaxID=1437360 RepID=A0A1M5R8E8_9BRAD|nr:hypothetical protein [Bradyrhizobium erythrophlei]SHH22592.1 hypothetical protein SAMN05444169_6410 [Bradyrhizobium erythrophlei]
MPALTRRRYPERQDCWHVYYGDVHVGTIAIRAGVPVDVDQWGWDCGFYPPSHHGRQTNGTAETFEQARVDFEAAWKEYLPKCSEADFEEHRRERARTAWKYAMWDKGCRMPTQSTDGRSQCFCGETIDIAGSAQHVYAAHMEMA